MVNTSTTQPEGAKARRVYMSIKEDIATGLHAVNTSLPGEQKLAALFGVSRVTVRRALDALCSEGIVRRVASSGTVVCETPNSTEPVAMNFNTLMPQLTEMGRNTTAQLLSFTYATPPAYVAQAMGIEEDARVQIATRVRLADGQPFSYLNTYVPESIASNYSESDLATTPLYTLLERGGATIDSADQSVSATLASPIVAEALGVAVGTALLTVQRVVRDSDGRGVEYLSAQYRPDLFRLDMQLTRVNEGTTRHWQPVLQTGDKAGITKEKSTRKKSTASATTAKSAASRKPLSTAKAASKDKKASSERAAPTVKKASTVKAAPATKSASVAKAASRPEHIDA